MDRIWDVLQIEETTDLGKIKRAYAARTKEIHPEENPQGFQVLYQAYREALRYASFEKTAMMQEARIPETKSEKENKAVSEDQSIYGFFGEDSEKLKKQWTGVEEIKHFQSVFNRQLSLWMRGGEFLDEAWTSYLQSDRYQNIMWNPIVMETISAGIMKYFQRERQIQLFFWNLYRLDIYEKWGEESFDEESLRALYRSLYSVSKEGMLKERVDSVNDFLERWKIQMEVWKKGGDFSEEWKAYLQSDNFINIMWINTVLETITAGMRGRFSCHGEAALFLWDLYGFEELGEGNCKEKGLALYRVLYPFYIFRIRREEYEKNKSSIVKEQNGRIYRMLMIGACVLILFVILLFIMPDVLEIVLEVGLTIAFWLLVYFLVKKFLGK